MLFQLLMLCFPASPFSSSFPPAVTFFWVTEAQGRGTDGSHPLSLHCDVCFHQLVELQQVLHSSQVLAQVLRLQPALPGTRGTSVSCPVPSPSGPLPAPTHIHLLRSLGSDHWHLTTSLAGSRCHTHVHTPTPVCQPSLTHIVTPQFCPGTTASLYSTPLLRKPSYQTLFLESLL